MKLLANSILYSGAVMACAALIGCAQNTAIPASAKIVGAGVGRIGYVAEENGSVFLLDASLKQRVFDAPVNRGDKVVVEPERDKIDVAGKAVEHKPPLSPEHVYRLYFDRL